MKRLTALVVLAIVLVGVVGTAEAQRLVKGRTVIWLGANGQRGAVIGPTTDDTGAQEIGEVGVHLAYNYFLSDAWTVVLSGGYGGHIESFEPAVGTKVKFTDHGFNVRLGFDRYAFINDAVALYAGPGFLFMSSQGEYSGSGDPAIDNKWPRVTQLGLNGRVGMYARLAPHYALFGHIGQVLAHGSVKDAIGKNTWWNSTHEGSVGLALDF